MGAMVENEDGEAFNYAVLAPNVAVAARRNARLIVEDEERARANAVLSIMKVGQWLTEIKEQLEHGQFLEWTQAEFRWSDRTAQRYMLASSVFGSNPTPVSYLPPAVVYQLSSPSTPEPVRDDVVHNSQAGNQLPPDEVRYRIKEAKAAERKASENAKLTKGRRSIGSASCAITKPKRLNAPPSANGAQTRRRERSRWSSSTLVTRLTPSSLSSRRRVGLSSRGRSRPRRRATLETQSNAVARFAASPMIRSFRWRGGCCGS